MAVRLFDPTGTIGGLSCEIALNKVLAAKADPSLSKRIIKLLHRAKLCVKQLELLTHEPTKAYLKTILKKEIERDITAKTGFAVRGEPVTDIVRKRP